MQGFISNKILTIIAAVVIIGGIGAAAIFMGSDLNSFVQEKQLEQNTQDNNTVAGENPDGTVGLDGTVGSESLGGAPATTEELLAQVIAGYSPDVVYCSYDITSEEVGLQHAEIWIKDANTVYVTQGGGRFNAVVNGNIMYLWGSDIGESGMILNYTPNNDMEADINSATNENGIISPEELVKIAENNSENADVANLSCEAIPAIDESIFLKPEGIEFIDPLNFAEEM